MSASEVLAEMSSKGARYAYLPGWQRVAQAPAGREHETAPRGWAYQPPMVFLASPVDVAQHFGADYQRVRFGQGVLGRVFMRGRDGGLTEDTNASDDGPDLCAAIDAEAAR